MAPSAFSSVPGGWGSGRSGSARLAWCSDEEIGNYNDDDDDDDLFIYIISFASVLFWQAPSASTS